MEAIFRSTGGTSAEAVARAIICNLRNDSRVSPERDILSELDWSSEPAFRTSYGSYFHSKIRTAKIPDFAKTHNEQNIVFKPGKRNRLHEGLLLAALFDVSRLHELYSHGYDQYWRGSKGNQPFSSYPRNEPASSSSVATWIENRMRDDRRRIDLIDSTLEYMRVRLLQGAFFHPSWCAVYDDLAKQPQNRWPMALGLGHWAGERKWCFAVCYSVKRAETVAIPTVLDSGLNPYFFPSPVIAKSGHPVDISFRGGDLIQEYINRQVPLYLEDHQKDAQQACHKTKVSNVELPIVRLRHWEKLKYEYQSVDIEAWMPRREAG